MGCYILRVGTLFFGVCVKAMAQWVCRTERGMARRMLGWEKCARSLSESWQQACTSPLRCIPCWESRLSHTKLLLDLKLLHSCDIQAKDAGKLQTLCFVEDLSISWDSQKNTKKAWCRPLTLIWINCLQPVSCADMLRHLYLDNLMVGCLIGSHPIHQLGCNSCCEYHSAVAVTANGCCRAPLIGEDHQSPCYWWEVGMKLDGGITVTK